MGKAPSAPNPVTTANAQTASNRETAITQAGLNMVDQTDAMGNSLKFSQNGTWSDGTPRFSATQTLSAPQQQLMNTGLATQQSLANLAKEQSGRISGLLSPDLDWSAQQGYLNDLTAQNLNPQWDRMAEQNETDLVNRGLRPGSAAYNAAKDQFQQSRSSAFNNANLNNYNSALQSQMTLRNQPLNEILALAGQGQVASPSFAATPQTGVAGTDVAGITNANFAQQMQGYQQNQAALGGLFSAGASLIPLLSDERVKENVRKVADHQCGFGIYEYDRTDTGAHEVGVIAQEVEALYPEWVDNSNEDGLKRVWYSRIPPYAPIH